MPLSRRSFIRAAAGGTLALVAAGGVYVVTRRPHTALEPWTIDAAMPSDIRLDVFRHAILAPNPHNRQPWQIRLIGGDEAAICCDLGRRLPETDPVDRQIVIGFGCFLELARIAAAERGYRLETTVFPKGNPEPRLDKRPIAHLRFVRDPQTPKDPLFAAILRRRSVKQPFDASRPVGEIEQERLRAAGQPEVLIHTSADSALVADLRDLTWKAWEVEVQTRRTYMESVELMRIGSAEIEANPDGIALSGPFIEALGAAGLISREQLADPASLAFQSGIDQYRQMLNGVASYAWMTTGGNSRTQQIRGGEAYVRLNLTATQLGLALHPVSQALQEFAEMRQISDAVNARLAIPSAERLQMLARIGYGPILSPAPRWPLAAKLESA